MIINIILKKTINIIKGTKYWANKQVLIYLDLEELHSAVVLIPLLMSPCLHDTVFGLLLGFA